MTIKVGISGFGRIGKLVYRIIEDLRLNSHLYYIIQVLNYFLF